MKFHGVKLTPKQKKQRFLREFPLTVPMTMSWPKAYLWSIWVKDNFPELEYNVDWRMFNIGDDQNFIVGFKHTDRLEKEMLLAVLMME